MMYTLLSESSGYRIFFPDTASIILPLYFTDVLAIVVNIDIEEILSIYKNKEIFIHMDTTYIYLGIRS